MYQSTRNIFDKHLFWETTKDYKWYIEKTTENKLSQNNLFVKEKDVKLNRKFHPKKYKVYVFKKPYKKSKMSLKIEYLALVPIYL